MNEQAVKNEALENSGRHHHNRMNATTQIMKERLPKKDLLCPGEIAGAIGLATTQPILQAIKCGQLAAAKSAVSGRFVIARTEAERYIDSTAYTPEEGAL